MTESTNVRRHAADSVASLVAWIDDNISRGNWPVGMKLPTERELEEQLQVSRNTLRKGLRHLTAQGKIARQVGRGSFVAMPGGTGENAKPSEMPVTSSAMTSLRALTKGLDDTQDLGATIRGASPVDIMEVRLLLEPPAAELAAHRANAENFAQMNECVARMEAAKTVADYEYWDGALHLTIMASARNDLLTALYTKINETRDLPEWERLKKRSLTPERRARYQKQHEDLVAALLARDPEKAKAALVEHLRQVRDNLLS